MFFHRTLLSPDTRVSTYGHGRTQVFLTCVRDGAGSGREDQQRPANARAKDKLTRAGFCIVTAVVGGMRSCTWQVCGSEGPGWAGAEVLKNTRFQMKDLFDKEGVPPLTSTKNGRLRRRDNHARRSWCAVHVRQRSRSGSGWVGSIDWANPIVEA